MVGKERVEEDAAGEGPSHLAIFRGWDAGGEQHKVPCFEIDSPWTPVVSVLLCLEGAGLGLVGCLPH